MAIVAATPALLSPITSLGRSHGDVRSRNAAPPIVEAEVVDESKRQGTDLPERMLPSHPQASLRPQTLSAMTYGSDALPRFAPHPQMGFLVNIVA